MNCSEIMSSNPATCRPSDTAADAARRMASENVGPIPVVDDGGKLLGIVTDRDLVLRVLAEGRDPNSTRIESVMSRSLVTCGPDDNVRDAMEAMKEHQVRRVPVVDGGGRLLGIIAQADIATRLAKDKQTGEVVEEISEPRR